jgi:uncharacterized repeat protein (TIGR04138 family)
VPSFQVGEKIQREIIEKRRKTRYRLDAYLFVLDGLAFHCARMGGKRHVNGRELSLGLLVFAHKQFGPLARIVLSGWGINATDDFGSIVYSLIDIGIMSRQPEDRPEDFAGVIDLDDYFKAQEWCEVDRDHLKKIHGA